MHKDDNAQFIAALQIKLAKHQLLTSPTQIKRFATGFRSGGGKAIAVIIPESLVELWRVLQVCVEFDKIVIMQAAKTGLTEGSTPSGDDYDRDVVIISTLKLNKLHLIKNGEQVIGFPGTTLYQLENALKPLKREPHSVIGSSCIGASVIGGICNNSGGALVKRGPAYTELAIYAQLDANGELKLVNHLGIDLGDDPESILSRLESGNFDKNSLPDTEKLASDHEYDQRIRDVDADTPSRFNADKRRLYEASGCAGKLAVFAVRLDTFEQEQNQQVFYIGTNDQSVLTEIRRHMLSQFTELPVAGEYMHREMYDISEKYGKDTFMMINQFGTDKMPQFFALKGKIDAWLNETWLKHLFPKNFSDKFIQFSSQLFKTQLPKRMNEYRNQYEHHLMLRMSGNGVNEAREFLKDYFANHVKGNFFECTPEEGSKAFLHRFAAAGAAIRYQAVHDKEAEGVLALDIALPRNEQNWFETLPPSIEDKLISKLYYGHFMCYVFHQDYVVKKGVDMHTLKQEMLALLDQRNAEYPAEHNVGHIYYAKPDLVEFYKQADPTNSFNPGIGKTSKLKNWCDCAH